MQDNYIISDIPPVAFGGIYALIDNNGKMYIGSSKKHKTAGFFAPNPL